MAQKLKYITCEQMSTGTSAKKDNLINLLSDMASTYVQATVFFLNQIQGKEKICRWEK